MKRSIFFTGMIIFSFFGFCLAEEVDLEKIVVTPYRYASDVSRVASSVTVISQKDIKNSNAQKVVDLLRPVPGVTVRDWYGNGTKVAVDIAGFGEQAALNVLVLVDGRRVNDVDLSGVDWSQIPLDQVEQIEIVRGGSAGVLYGDNASSGVISIITKKGSGKPKWNLETRYGSHDMNKQSLSLGGKLDNKFSYWLSGSREGTHGYRNNTFNKASDFASKFAYDFSDALSVHFDSGFHASTYGMPASINQTVIDQYGRRYARNGDDHANNKDYYFVLGSKSDFAESGVFDVDFTYRVKNTDSYFLTSGLNTQRNKIDTFGITPKYTLGNSILNHENKLIAGVDYYRVYFRSDIYNRLRDDDWKNYTRINKTSIGGYLQDEFSIFKQLVLVGGYRYEAACYSFGYHDYTGYNPDLDKKVNPKQKVFNTGLVYTYKDDSSAFFNAGKSFRFPEVDEFTYNDASWQQQLNTNLKPQSAMNYQLGLRHKFSDHLKSSLSLFRMNVKNELYYNSTGGPNLAGQNENYNKTIHEGFECSMDAKPNNWMALFGNYTFTNAYFDDGDYNENEIPLVPRHKASIGLKFILPKNMTFNITGTYVGQRYFLNDQANTYSRLNGYMVADTNLSWHCKDLKITFGINNLFSKQYSEYAGVTVSNGVKFYYPSPKRNFNLKVDYAF